VSVWLSLNLSGEPNPLLILTGEDEELDPLLLKFYFVIYIF
jgi:hypothetical protein